MIRTMIWKELREGLRYAILAALLFTGGILYAFWQYQGSVDRNGYNAPLSGPFLLLTAVGCPVAGFALGLLAFMPESRRDRWAFLVHRPAWRTAIFGSKILGASLLYALGIGLPLAAAVAYAGTPGHFAYPFLPGMALPVVMDFACGFAYLSAGALIAMRQAAWVRSRILPVSVAILTSIIMVADDLRWGMLALAIATLLLGVAAWGTFRGAGQWRPTPAPAKVGLFLTVGVGLAIVAGVAVIFLGFFAAGNASSYATETNTMDDNGHVYRATYRLGRMEKLAEPDGSPPIDAAAARRHMESHYEHGYVQLYLTAPPPEPPRFLEAYAGPYRMPEANVHYIGRTNNARWYFIRSTRRAVGYDVVSGLAVQSFGPDGFRDDTAAAPFPPGTGFASWANDLIFNANDVYRFDVEHRLIEPIVHDPAGHIHDACSDREGDDRYVTVAVGNQVRLFRDDRPIATLPVPRDPATLGVGSPSILGKNHDRFALWQQNAFWASANRWEVPTYVTIYSLPDGRALSEQTVAPLPMTVYDENHWTQIVPASLVPLGLGVTMETLHLIALHQTPADYIRGTPWWAWLGIAAAFAGAIVSAALTWWIATRHAFTKRARLGWTTLNFLLGLTSLATMLAIRDWPARVPCPKCGRKRATNTDQCHHCGASWGDSPRDGTEIFEADAILSADLAPSH